MRARLAPVDDLGLRVDRVAVEDRLRELDLLEPEIADGRAERGLADGEPDRDAEREQAVDVRPSELRLARGVEVDVQRLRIHGQLRQEHVDRLVTSAPELMLEPR